MEGERSRRPRRLDDSQYEEVDQALRHTLREVGLSSTLWDGKTLSAWIERRFQVRLGVPQCQRLFQQQGFRLRKPRPLIAHADRERPKRHKKTPSVKHRPLG